jgi:hypothetical protein
MASLGTRRLGAIAVLMASLPAPVAAEGTKAVPVLGGSLSAGFGPSTGFYQSLELSMAFFMVGNTIPAVSVGSTFQGAAVGYMYGEISALLPVLQVTGPSLGLGAGLQVVDHRRAPALHFFVGLPTPPMPLDYFMPYLEPYFRPQLGFGSGVFIFEAGLMLKFIVTNSKFDLSN